MHRAAKGGAVLYQLGILIFVLIMGLLYCCGARSETPPAPQLFDVRDYGAEPDAPTDAGPAIRAAIAEAMEAGGPAVVQLEAGAYRVAPAEGAEDALVISEADGLRLQGVGPATRLIVTDPTVGGVRFQDCRDVRIADLAIDYDPLPFTQGTVVASDPAAGWFDIRWDAGHLTPDAHCFQVSHGNWALVVQLPQDGPEQYGPLPVYIDAWAPGEDGVWRGQTKDGAATAAAGVRPGARLVYMARRNIGAAVTAWASRDVTLDGVAVYAAPSPAMLLGLNENVVIRGLRVERAPGSDRLLSTDADGIHCLGARGALHIEACAFSAMADDSINIHARAAAIVDRLGPDRLLVNPSGTVQFRKGDRVQVYDPERGAIRHAERVVTAVEPRDAHVALAFDEPIGPVTAGSDFRDADHVFNLDACGAGAVIRDNHFGIHRGRGVLLKTVDARIEGNVFENREGWAIAMHQLQSWGEGPAAQRVLIRDNTFEGMSPGWSAFIDIRPSRRGDVPAEGRPVRDIRIEGNRMRNPANGVLHAIGVEGLTFVDNVVTCAPGSRLRPGALITVRNAAGVRVDKLTATDPNEETTALVHLGGDVENAEIVETGIAATLRPGVPAVSREEAP